jgi:radical SAM superfamily enzyme YgiQ (UPF0313 family)
MKVLFVYSVERGPSLQHPLRMPAQIQLGISYISSMLKADGAVTDLMVLTSEQESASLALARRTLADFAPQIVAFTCVASQYPFISRVATVLKRASPRVFSVIGGPHVSLNPDAPSQGPFDAVCIGEGEYPMLELAQRLRDCRPAVDIQNLWLKRPDGPVQRNTTRPFISDLDSLPFPDRVMWHRWIDTAEPNVPTVLLGRGCPYLCTYCCNHALRKLALGKYVRFRSPGNIVQEIKELYEAHSGNLASFGLEVETLCLFKPWTFQLCEGLSKYNATLREPLVFQANYRISAASLDEELFRAMAAANIRHLNIGLEAGSERIRREVLKRNYSNQQFFRAVQLARDHGIKFNVFNMIGIPGETRADHYETIRLNRQARPHASFTSIFFPYPGTELYRECQSRGLLDKSLDVRRERQKAALDLPEFPRRQVQRAYDLFDFRIHAGDWPLHVRARKLVRLYVHKSLILDRLFELFLPLWRRLGKMGKVDRSYGRCTDS